MLTILRRRLRAMLTAMRGKPLVERVASAKLPTEDGEFEIHVFESRVDSGTHTALVRGALGAGENVLARVHSACLTGDVFHSARCDCGQQLKVAMARVAAEGRGVILYLNQEGRGIGLANKIRAYALQDEGYDTVEANERLGFPADLREYETCVLILRDLGVRSIRLMSNNPRKLAGVVGDGVMLSERIPLEVSPSDSNRRYLRTKKEKLGHQLSEV
jgi:3,4-dihydroxy 2-butanone 4-phosphate synthase/GTP cyclohydrolase II